MSTPTSEPYTLYDPSKPLSSVYKKRAAKELGENPEQISAHLESFKRWLNSMPHLKCNVDDNLLLAFLRQAKYNHLKAQTRFDKFCTFRTSSTEGYPIWFQNFKERKAISDKIVEMKYMTALGFTQDGSLAALIKCKNINFNQITLAEMQGANQIWCDKCIVDQRFQIGGMCIIMDLTDIGKDFVMKMFDPKFTRLHVKYLQECLPFRIRKFVIYNAPKIFETTFKIISEWFTEKNKARIMMVGTNMNLAYDAIPGLKDIMPECYGGKAKLSFEELCDKISDTMKSIPDIAASWAIAVDDSKRPKESKNLFGFYKDLTDDLMGKAGTYVKLNDEI